MSSWMHLMLNSRRKQDLITEDSGSKYKEPILNLEKKYINLFL
jgi:hypothetical protein